MDAAAIFDLVDTERIGSISDIELVTGSRQLAVALGSSQYHLPTFPH